MYKFRQIVRMDFINLITNPMWIFFSAPFPFLMVLILGFLSSGDWGKTVTAYDYYGITMMIYAILNTATISANSFMEERIKGGNLRIIHAPVKPFEIYFSKILASFAFSSLCHLITGIALHFAAGVHYGSASLPAALAIFALLEFFSSALGVLLCCALKSENAANQILSLVITLFAIMGGLFFRVDGLGIAAERISDLFAVKWVSIALFRLIWDNDAALVLPTAALLIAGSALFIGASAILFRTEDYI
jgi:ABC-2 type transport system permease protein